MKNLVEFEHHYNIIQWALTSVKSIFAFNSKRCHSLDKLSYRHLHVIKRTGFEKVALSKKIFSNFLAMPIFSKLSMSHKNQDGLSITLLII